MFKGSLKVYNDDGTLYKEYPNAYVLSGRYFALEAMFPCERSGATWLSELAGDTRYFEAGSSTVVNGNAGPTSTTSVDATAWNNSGLYEYKLGVSITDETTRPLVSISQRRGREIDVEILLDSSKIDGDDVYEIGLFLGNVLGKPEHSPDDELWNDDDRANAMIARILCVNYNSSTGEWDADPIDVSSGTKTVIYTMRMV